MFGKMFVGDLSYYCSAFHLLNGLLSISFLVLRLFRPFCSTLFANADTPCGLDWNETNVLFFLGCILVVKNRKLPSFREYLAKMFMFGKVANAVLFFYADFRYAILYVVLALVVLIVFPEPIYCGRQNVTYFNSSTLEEELTSSPRVTWLIEFYTPWSGRCQRFAPVFADLSLSYSHNHLKFGKIDVGRYTDVAKKYKVDVSSLSQQLPTLVLFEGGKETLRKPGRNSKGATVKHHFTKENIISDYNLETLYQTTKSKAQKKADKAEMSSDKKTN
ncbi:thioredoxin-related transmembrane protein 2-like [Acanthaster planci]|uniref:Thioredoxin-related transmembrane protein 2-like n=1 Tax=Acanthaster planci TaxID=133434 RepID=A0A8B7Y1N7_ACAPL|nr:thioredoxin-related transmembrane protein 2-like [Acanthaster planci]